MALRYGYFDSEITGTDSEGMPIFDRAETSDLFARFISNLVTSGIAGTPVPAHKAADGGIGTLRGTGSKEYLRRLCTKQSGSTGYALSVYGIGSDVGKVTDPVLV